MIQNQLSVCASILQVVVVVPGLLRAPQSYKIASFRGQCPAPRPFLPCCPTPLAWAAPLAGRLALRDLPEWRFDARSMISQNILTHVDRDASGVLSLTRAVRVGAWGSYHPRFWLEQFAQKTGAVMNRQAQQGTSQTEQVVLCGHPDQGRHRRGVQQPCCSRK